MKCCNHAWPSGDHSMLHSRGLVCLALVWASPTPQLLVLHLLPARTSCGPQTPGECRACFPVPARPCSQALPRKASAPPPASAHTPGNAGRRVCECSPSSSAGLFWPPIAPMHPPNIGWAASRRDLCQKASKVFLTRSLCALRACIIRGPARASSPSLATVPWHRPATANPLTASIPPSVGLPPLCCPRAIWGPRRRRAQPWRRVPRGRRHHRQGRRVLHDAAAGAMPHPLLSICVALSSQKHAGVWENIVAGEARSRKLLNLEKRRGECRRIYRGGRMCRTNWDDESASGAQTWQSPPSLNLEPLTVLMRLDVDAGAAEAIRGADGAAPPGGGDGASAAGGIRLPAAAGRRVQPKAAAGQPLATRGGSGSRVQSLSVMSGFDVARSIA